MGCKVERTDTGVEINVHLFESREAAEQYIKVARRHTFDRTLPAIDPRDTLALYTGEVVGEYASLRWDEQSGIWRACFWIEGLVRAALANPVEAKLAWHGEFRTSLHEPWQAVVNGSDNAISYATKRDAANAAFFEVARRLAAATVQEDQHA